ncbi:DUF2911 domain-containing protein [Adhaeribacter radiodurans]|uniref:DUF2911 domain-containing protein n=1 Tax=Adhaeribacter radiodurans TaxID=2745197 RepID=A0A7L7LEJ6_9BACT|nr:DUF2911 domain-containing protein [Adhaeribacter radiodurans]QMU31240.1 DUF2911 domain-containing protein [Adhaeribacter radiodurans]
MLLKQFRASLLLCLFFTISTLAFAQQDKTQRVSPPATASGKIGSTQVTINYSSPSVKGRKIFGEKEPYGKVWRTGANEATTITFDKDVTIEGQPLKAGTYALFTIPNQTEWTVIFNKTAEQWGAFKYDQAQDALRVKVKPTTTKELTERLKIDVTPKGKNTGTVTMKWENAQVSFRIKTNDASA